MHTKRVAKGALLYSIAGILTGGVSLVLLPLLTRVLSPQDFGVLSNATAISLLLTPFVTLGLGASVARSYHEYDHTNEAFSRIFSTSFWLQVVMGGIVISIVSFIYVYKDINVISGVDYWHMIPILLLFVSNAPRDICGQLLTAKEEHTQSSLIQIIGFVVATLATIVFIFPLDLGSLGRLYGKTLGGIAAAIIALKFSNIRKYLRFNIDGNAMKESLRYGLPLVPYAFAMSGVMYADRLFLEHYSTMEKVGLYSAAKTFALGGNFIYSSATRAWMPRYIELKSSGQGSVALKIQWAKMNLFSLLLAVFVVVGPLLYPWLVDESYSASVLILPVLGCAIYLNGIFVSQVTYINYLKKNQILPVFAILGLVFNLLACVYFIPRYGIQGAAWSAVVGFCVMNILLFFYCIMGKRDLIERVLIPLLAMLFGGGGALFLYYFAVGRELSVQLFWIVTVYLLLLGAWYFGGRFLIDNWLIKDEFPRS